MGFPKHTGALHGHMSAAVILNPINEFQDEDRVGAERFNLLSFRCNDACGAPRGAWLANGQLGIEAF